MPEWALGPYWRYSRAMDLSASIVIHASAERVYGFVSDPANDVRWRTGVTESGLTTDPPMALGSEGYVRVGSQVGRPSTRPRVSANSFWVPCGDTSNIAEPNRPDRGWPGPGRDRAPRGRNSIRGRGER